MPETPAPAFYITTPIYYASERPHIGNAYCSVATDAIARYKKLRGYDVRFLTGTDEHGQKVERMAANRGVAPREYVDGIVAWTMKLWKLMDIDYDVFMRTTDGFHVEAVKKIFRKLYDQGDIYKGKYEGLYCTPCETFFTEKQLAGSKCPDCGREVELISEEAYFFRLSAYQERLMRHIEDNPRFIAPRSRQNEMVNNFLKPGLEDLCVSRTSFKWGVPVDFDPAHVVYVWVDALPNYITSLGYMSGDDSLLKRYWPADIHIVGKEIVRFHTIIWPAMLMALDLPLPKQVFGHGWLTVDGEKMSKSKGNVVDPWALTEKYGIDAVRYFLLREITFGADGDFSAGALVGRINSDLANDLGNLLSRTVGMIDRYFGGVLPAEQAGNPLDGEIRAFAAKTAESAGEAMDRLQPHAALAEIWNFVRRMNKYADETQPWVLVKDGGRKAELAGVMYTLAESLRIIAVLISPFMTRAPGKIRAQLNIPENNTDWDGASKFGLLPKEVKITKGEVIFPRIDVKTAAVPATVHDISKRPERGNDTRHPGSGNDISHPGSGNDTRHPGSGNDTCHPGSGNDTCHPGSGNDISHPERSEGSKILRSAQNDKNDVFEKNDKNDGFEMKDKNDGFDMKDKNDGFETKDKNYITIEDFAKVKLLLGKVLSCERMEGSDKLLKLHIDLGAGEKPRQIVSGIAKWYAPEEMAGKTVVVAANLKPAKLRGVMSEGMILAASDENGNLAVITADEKGVGIGAEVR
ncbi:MAG: methionine--tRNA ligase [Firmicutes bacterium]|nr:methionine--tRNA ligase [Bacillota bacterium]